MLRSHKGEVRKDHDHGTETSQISARRIRQATLGIWITAGLALIVRLAWPSAWPSGRFDSAFLVLFVIMLAPWLAYLLSEITLPGGGGIKFRDLPQQVEELRADIVGGEASAQLAIQTQIAAIKADIEAIKSSSTTRMKPTSEDPQSQIEKLAEEYESIRNNMPRGPERTAKMTEIVGQMITAIQQAPDLDLSGDLKKDRRGLRLAGYAHQYLRPNPDQLIPLALNIVNDDKRPPDQADRPFGQYWALRALRRVYEKAKLRDDEFDQNTFRQLQSYLQSISAGSDRAYELRRILDQFTGKRT